MTDRLEQIEFTLMELGSEVFQLKHQLLDAQEKQDQLIQALKGFKSILDEKGLITAEEFENQIQLDNLTGAFGEDGELDPFDKVAKRETH